jgi:MSHA biogenesis protein MshQ
MKIIVKVIFMVFVLLAGQAMAVTCTSNGSGDWKDNNWTPSDPCENGSSGPPAGSNVVIANGYSIKVDANTLAVANVTINAGGTLTGNSGDTLSLTGNFTNNGTFTANSGTVALTGAAQTITGNVTFYNLSFGSTLLTLAGNVTVTNSVTGTINLASTCPADYTLTLPNGNVMHSCNSSTVDFINRASANPTTAGAAVAWTVVFSTSVTGVSTGNFGLAPTSGVTGAAITSVAGSGTTWTVNATTGTGTGAGTLGLNMVNVTGISPAVTTAMPFVGQVYTVSGPFCSPPSNIPAGVTVSCQCDTFARATLNPSTIFNSNWLVSTSDSTGILPSIVNSSYLRLTNNTGNNAKAATVPGIFPAAGNYISVEFQQYAYNGTGADGIAVTLSDYSVPAVPGAYGGSLGYAQETGIHDGFAGGWLGVALDEYGNYQNTNEGRLGGKGFIVQSVGARGSGSGQTGYRWLAGTGSLTPNIDDRTSTSASRGYYYQVIVDARNEPTSTAVAVNRDTGSGYAPLISIGNVYTAATGQGFTQAPVPANWQISFTGSTGGSTNIHEIGGLRICASSMFPPGGGTASGFNAVDEAYGTPPGVAVQNYLGGHIYTKLAGTPFKLNVAALANSQIVTTYAFGGSKSVTVKLVDNSDSLADTTKDCTLSCTSTCTGKPAVTGGTQTLTFASGASDKGQKQSSNFTINSAYKKLVAIISDGTSSACSTDSFSVRPNALTLATTATATTSGGTPVFRAGTDPFTVNVSAANTAYTGTPTIGSIDTSPMGVGTWLAGSLSAGTTLAAAVLGVSTNSSTYSEVGLFKLAGYGVSDDTSARGVFDATWTGVDSISTKGDCVAGNYSNVKNANGKYGCNFGLATDANFGRFIPHHFNVSVNSNGTMAAACPAGGFTYTGQAMGYGTAPSLTIKPMSAATGGAVTQNYQGIFQKLVASGVSITSPTADATQLGRDGVTKTDLLAIPAMGVGTLANSSGIITYTLNASDQFTYTRNANALTGPYTTAIPLVVTAVAENEVSAAGSLLPLPQTLSPTGTSMRYGRARMFNAYGSELLDLPVVFRTEYLASTVPSNAWSVNASDSCTNAALSFAPVGTPNITSNTCVLEPGNNSGKGCAAVLTSGQTNRRYLETGVTGTDSSGVAGFAGNFNLWLRAPGAAHVGSIDITATVDSWLQYPWTGSAAANPTARATFGIYKSPLIYRRENY